MLVELCSLNIAGVGVSKRENTFIYKIYSFLVIAVKHNDQTARNLFFEFEQRLNREIVTLNFDRTAYRLDEKAKLALMTHQTFIRIIYNAFGSSR